MRFSHYLALLPALFCLAAAPSFAQKTAATAKPAVEESAPAAAILAPAALPDRIVRPMMAIDPVTLKAEGVEIRLWGIKPAATNETPLELKALDLLDTLIDGQVVNCKIEGGQLPVLWGRCVVQSSTDLSLELLNNGYAVRDRRLTYNTAYASAYGQAEEIARLAKKGVWKYLAEAEKEASSPNWLSSNMNTVVPFALVAGPLSGLMFVGFILWFWMSRMSKAQQADAEAAKRKEAVLQSREKNVLLTTLEGELLENKNKVEAFLVIYGDMLRGLKEGRETPKYQQVGDIVQKHPSFSKTVFEANVGKLSLLGIKLAGQVSKLYTGLPKEQEYINLEPDVPLDTAIKLIEKILNEAEAVLAPLDSSIAALQSASAQRAEQG